jgi:[ribosomal protein S18]-alanine N-acetyltransferase
LANEYPVSIRPATTEDLPELIRLGSESRTGAHWSEAQYWSLLADEGSSGSRLTLVAECELPIDGRGKVVGFLIARHMAPEWELENIVVGAEVRGKGIGKRLMENLLTRAKQVNSESVFLEVRESNKAAHALYGKLGFAEMGRRKSYYSNPIEDAVLYRKDL